MFSGVAVYVEGLSILLCSSKVRISVLRNVGNTAVPLTPTGVALCCSGAGHFSQNRKANSCRDSLLDQRPHWPPELLIGSLPSDLLYFLSVSPPPTISIVPFPLLTRSQSPVCAETFCWIRGGTDFQNSRPQEPEDQRENRNQGAKHPSIKDILRNQDLAFITLNPHA